MQPSNPQKWRFKMCVNAGQSGFMYDFSVLEKTVLIKETVHVKNFVWSLCKGIPRQQNFKMCFDNWFCTFPLLWKMTSFGILTTATIRPNRPASCPLKSKVDFKNEGRGSLSFRTDTYSVVMLLRWTQSQFNLIQHSAQLQVVALSKIEMQHQKST